MKAQTEANRIPRLSGATRPLGAVTGHPAKRVTLGLLVARPGLAGTFFAVAIMFLIAGAAVNVAFLVFAGFATFGAILACFPEAVADAAEGAEMLHRIGSHHDELALFSIDSSEERSMQPGTSEYHSRWNG